MDSAISVQDLAAALEGLLAKNPSKAGQRLCSERDLSALLNVDRMKIQKAFDLLVEKGILARRHGSGTYIRKVPKASGLSVKVKVGAKILKPQDLFAKPSSTVVRRQIRSEHRQLRLAILLNELWKSESNELVISGIKDRVKQEGHLLENYTSRRDGAPISTSQLVEKLRNEPADGYILWTPYLGVLKEAFGGETPPAVFIGFESRAVDLKCTPVVRIDLEDSLVRGIALLADFGFEKIGLIGLDSRDRRASDDHQLYADTMSRRGLAYRSTTVCDLDDESVLKQMRKLFSSPTRPDAVYVTDDILLGHVAKAWKVLNIVPGGNLGVITFANRGNPLPSSSEWSRIEFVPFQLGRMAVDSLLREIETAGEDICSFEHLGLWQPGNTHYLPGHISFQKKSDF